MVGLAVAAMALFVPFAGAAPAGSPLPNACANPGAPVPTAAPSIDLHNGRVVTVTTLSDTVNGDVSSIDALLASPGSDGVSLREAIAVSNNSGAAETIEFAPQLAGGTIKVNPDLPPLTGGHLTIDGDVDGDGAPDITLDGSTAPSNWPAALTIVSSGNTVYGLSISHFPDRGVMLEPCLTPCSGTVIGGNSVVDNLVSDDGDMGITIGPPPPFDAGNLAATVDGNQVRDTLIAGNTIQGAQTLDIYLWGGGAGVTNNQIANTTIVANRTDGGPVGIALSPADSASDSTSSPPEVRALRPVRYSEGNTISNTIISANTIDQAVNAGVNVEAGNQGNRGNAIQCMKIVSNTIKSISPSGSGLALVAGSLSGSRGTSQDTINNIDVTGNTIQGGATSVLVGAGEQTGDGYTGAEGVTTNTVNGVQITDNTFSDQGQFGIRVWGGKSCGSNYDVSGNTVSGLTIGRNTLTTVTGTDTGIDIVGGWSCGQAATGNTVENVEIRDNTIHGYRTALRLNGGEGATSTGNLTSVALGANQLAGNSAAIGAAANDGGATGNTLTVSRPPWTVVAGTPELKPSRPRAGKTLTVTVELTRSDTGEPLRTGLVLCRATAAGKPVHAKGRLHSGAATCTFALAGRTRGDRFKGTLTVTSAAHRLRRSVTATIR